MINCDDYVSLSDDDNVVEVTSNIVSKSHDSVGDTDAIETIIIDNDIGEPSSHGDDADSQKSTDSFVRSIKRFQQENSAFALFLDTCLDLENSDGMMRIIQRTVIKAYEQCNNVYKASPKFLRIINKSIYRLKTDPDHKFSHINNFVLSMRANKFKKRVDIITLATNLKGKDTPGLISKSKHRKSKSININDSIILDSDEEQQSIPTVSLDDNDNSNDIIWLESDKENHKTANSPSKSQDSFLVPHVEVQFECNQENLTSVEPKVPPSEVPYYNKEILDSVEAIEKKIAYLKKEIIVLEEMEVNNDSVSSPYILCESYKEQVVELYKKICYLIGEEPVKKHKVRLKVLEGHPLGPVKRLELFINNNIGQDGLPLFPDFSDVIQCVMLANLDDNMGWKKQQIMREAIALFTQCGRALQKKRQKREYRDLLTRVRKASPDPADSDPELQRRLEQNRTAGVKKELDLLERYAQLQDLPQRSRLTLEQLSTNNLPPSTSNHVHRIEPPMDPSSTIPAEQPLDPSGVQKEHKQMESICNENHQTDQTSNIEPESTCNGVNVPQNENKSDTNKHEHQSELSSSYDIVVSDEDSNFEPPEIQFSLQVKEETLETHTNVPETENHETIIKKELKKEPFDIIKMLEELGDEYTTSVIDIEDPFLVIEISSDSSDDDDEMDCEEGS